MQTFILYKWRDSFRKHLSWYDILCWEHGRRVYKSLIFSPLQAIFPALKICSKGLGAIKDDEMVLRAEEREGGGEEFVEVASKKIFLEVLPLE